MRFLSAILLLLLSLGSGMAQVPVTGAGLPKPAAGGFTPSCSQSTTFFANATIISDVTLTADKTNYDTLICGLVSDGVWNFDALYIWASPTSNAALINLANPGIFTAALNGTTAGAFTAYQGYTGNGTDFYITTGFNPSTATSPNFVQNSANLGIYVLNARTVGGLIWDIGSTSGTDGLLFSPVDGGNNIYLSLNSTSVVASVSSGNSQGAWNGTRVTSNLEEVYLNSAETALNGSNDTSQAPLNSSVIFFALNPSLFFTTDQIAAGWIGKGLTNVQSCKVNNRINTYMAGLSVPKNVYSNSAC